MAFRIKYCSFPFFKAKSEQMSHLNMTVLIGRLFTHGLQCHITRALLHVRPGRALVRELRDAQSQHSDAFHTLHDLCQ